MSHDALRTGLYSKHSDRWDRRLRSASVETRGYNIESDLRTGVGSVWSCYKVMTKKERAHLTELAANIEGAWRMQRLTELRLFVFWGLDRLEPSLTNSCPLDAANEGINTQTQSLQASMYQQHWWEIRNDRLPQDKEGSHSATNKPGFHVTSVAQHLHQTQSLCVHGFLCDSGLEVLVPPDSWQTLQLAPQHHHSGNPISAFIQMPWRDKQPTAQAAVVILLFECHRPHA